MTRGTLITFEGGEGTGKSTQGKLLKTFLEQQGYDVLMTREPGGSPGAESIRQLIVEGSPTKWDALTEYLLLSAARRDHLEQTLKPALDQGKWVICDRFFDSSLAYQGAGHGLDERVLWTVYKFIAGDFKPDLTFIFDLPIEEGLARARQRAGAEDRFEKMIPSFHERVRQKLQSIALEDPQRCRLIKVQGTLEDISQEVQRHLKESGLLRL